MKKNSIKLIAIIVGVLIVATLGGFFISKAVNKSSYTIRFEENGGTKVSDLSVKKWEKVELPNDIEKGGYQFSGWYYDKDFKKKCDTQIKVSSDITLYANWSIETYSITYELNGGTFIDEPVMKYNVLDNIALPKAQKDDKGFAGWFTSEDYSEKLKKIHMGTYGDLTLYALFEDVYSVSGSLSCNSLYRLDLSDMKVDVVGLDYEVSINKDGTWNTRLPEGTHKIRFENKLFYKEIEVEVKAQPISNVAVRFNQPKVNASYEFEGTMYPLESKDTWTYEGDAVVNTLTNDSYSYVAGLQSKNFVISATYVNTTVPTDELQYGFMLSSGVEEKNSYTFVRRVDGYRFRNVLDWDGRINHTVKGLTSINSEKKGNKVELTLVRQENKYYLICEGVITVFEFVQKGKTCEIYVDGKKTTSQGDLKTFPVYLNGPTCVGLYVDSAEVKTTYWYSTSKSVVDKYVKTNIALNYDASRGSVSTLKSKYYYGEDVTLNIQPKEGYGVASIKLNGKDELIDNYKDGKLVIKKAEKNITLDIKFEPVYSVSGSVLEPLNMHVKDYSKATIKVDNRTEYAVGGKEFKIMSFAGEHTLTYNVGNYIGVKTVNVTEQGLTDVKIQLVHKVNDNVTKNGKAYRNVVTYSYNEDGTVQTNKTTDNQVTYIEGLNSDKFVVSAKFTSVGTSAGEMQFGYRLATGTAVDEIYQIVRRATGYRFYGTWESRINTGKGLDALPQTKGNTNAVVVEFDLVRDGNKYYMINTLSDGNVIIDTLEFKAIKGSKEYAIYYNGIRQTSTEKMEKFPLFVDGKGKVGLVVSGTAAKIAYSYTTNEAEVDDVIAEITKTVKVSGTINTEGFEKADLSGLKLLVNGAEQKITVKGREFTADVLCRKGTVLEFVTDNFYGKRTLDLSQDVNGVAVNMIHKVNDNKDQNGTTYANARDYLYNEDGTIQTTGNGTNQVTYIEGLESENFMVSAKFTTTAKSNGKEVHLGYRLATGTTANDMYQFMCRAGGYRFLGDWDSRIGRGSNAGALTYLAEQNKYTEANTEIELGLVRQGNKYYMVYTWPNGKVAVDTLEFVAKENTNPQTYDIYYNGVKQTSDGKMTEFPLYIDGPSKVGFLVENVNAKIKYSYTTDKTAVDEYLDQVYYDPSVAGYIEEARALGQGYEQGVGSNKINVDKDTTIFIGDSFFNRKNWWTNFYTEYYKDANVFCAGIGGTQTKHWKHLIEEVFAVYGDSAPKNIVMHLGTNDLRDAANTASDVVKGLKEVFDILHTKYPQTKIYYFGITNRGDINVADKMNEVNSTISTWSESQEYLTYIDTSDKITVDMLRADKLHPQLDTYAVFVRELEKAGCVILDQDGNALEGKLATVSGTISVPGFEKADLSTVKMLVNGIENSFTLNGNNFTAEVEKGNNILLEFDSNYFYGKKTISLSKDVDNVTVIMSHKVNDNKDQNGTTYENARDFLYNEDGSIRTQPAGTNLNNQVTYIKGLNSDKFAVKAQFTTVGTSAGEIRVGYRLATGTTADNIYQFLRRDNTYRFLNSWASRINPGNNLPKIPTAAGSTQEIVVEFGLVRDGNKYYMISTLADGTEKVDTLEFIKKNNSTQYEIFFNGVKQKSGGAMEEFPLYISGPSKVGLIVEGTAADISYSYTTDAGEIDEYLTEAYTVEGSVTTTNTTNNQVLNISGLEDDKFMITATYTTVGTSKDEVQFGYRLTDSDTNDYYSIMRRATGYRFLSTWDSRISTGGGLTRVPAKGSSSEVTIKFGLVRDGNKYYMLNTLADGRIIIDTLEFVKKNNSTQYEIFYNGVKQKSSGAMEEFPLYVDGPSKVGILISGTAANVSYSYTTVENKIGEVIAEANGTMTRTKTTDAGAEVKNQAQSVAGLNADRFAIGGTFISKGLSVDENHFGFRLRTTAESIPNYRFLRWTNGYRLVSDGWTDRINKGAGLTALPAKGNTTSVKIEFGLVRDENKYYLINTLADGRVIIDTLEFVKKENSTKYEIFYNGVKQKSVTSMEEFPLYVDGPSQVDIFTNGTGVDVSYWYTANDIEINKIIYSLSK